MRISILVLLITCLFGSGAEARHRHHAHHFHSAASVIATVKTVTGHTIRVAKHLEPAWQALIADFKQAGYIPRRIGCFATGGHVAHSRHYAGAACDFDQRGWGLTTPFMYSTKANELIKKHGFRNGCSFSDCGHVDDGLPGRNPGRRPGQGGPHSSNQTCTGPSISSDMIGLPGGIVTLPIVPGARRIAPLAGRSQGAAGNAFRSTLPRGERLSLAEGASGPLNFSS